MKEDQLIITEERLNKFTRVAASRQHMTVILENVHDKHNIGAVMRTCDSVGVQELYILYTDPGLGKAHLDRVKASSTGVRKWLDIHFYMDVDECMTAVKKKYDKIYATHLDEESQSLYATDLSEGVALLFGNERDGVSQEALTYADGNILIPQYGMVDSLNISVACAVTLYEASRQRLSKDMYISPESISSENQVHLDRFLAKHHEKYVQKAQK